ncbi:MAG: protein-disulfide reductase DsbD family protein [Bdellovibrio sp.]
MVKLLIPLLYFVFSLPLAALAKDKIEDLTRLDVLQESQSLHPGQLTHIGFQVHLLKKGWHTYWKNPGDAGAPPKLKVSANLAGIEVGEILFPTPLRIETKTLVSFAYKDEVLYLAPLRIPKSVSPGQRLNITVDFEWLICLEVCIPAHEKHELSWEIRSEARIVPGPNAGLLKHAISALPVRRGEQGELDEKLVGRFQGLPGKVQFVDFFAAPDSALLLNKPKGVIRGPEAEIQFVKAEFAEGAPKARGLLVVENTQKQRSSFEWSPEPRWFEASVLKAKPGFQIWMLILAFAGGLILNLMPCVLPVLSLKLLSLSKQTNLNRSQIRFDNLSYTAGVVLSFVLMGLTLLVLRETGEKLGWGFQLQSPLFLALMAVLFFVIALNLIGVYEFDLVNPNWGSRHLKHPALSSFFTGVLAVIVASPCTAPFMGAALGYALSQPGPVFILVFVCLGLGLSFPYLLFALQPGFVRFLPKPGAWMKTLKELMAFPMLLTALWVLWVLAQVGDSFAVTLTLALMVGLAFCFWLPSRRLAWILAALQVLSFIAFFDFSKLGTQSAARDAADKSRLWQTFDSRQLEAERSQIYFVNFTADWCLTCKINERTIFQATSLQEFFRDQNVALMQADWTQRNPEISDFLARYDRIGVPLYLVFPKGKGAPIILPELITENLVRDAIKSIQQGETR